MPISLSTSWSNGGSENTEGMHETWPHAAATLNSTAAAEQPQPLEGAHTRTKRSRAGVKESGTAMRTKADGPHDSPHSRTYSVHIIDFVPSREHVAMAVGESDSMHSGGQR